MHDDHAVYNRGTAAARCSKAFEHLQRLQQPRSCRAFATANRSRLWQVARQLAQMWCPSRTSLIKVFARCTFATSRRAARGVNRARELKNNCKLPAYSSDPDVCLFIVAIRTKNCRPLSSTLQQRSDIVGLCTMLGLVPIPH